MMAEAGLGALWFAAAFAARMRLEDSALSPEEEELASRLVAEKYGCDEWNLRY